MPAWNGARPSGSRGDGLVHAADWPSKLRACRRAASKRRSAHEGEERKWVATRCSPSAGSRCSPMPRRRTSCPLPQHGCRSQLIFYPQTDPVYLTNYRRMGNQQNNRNRAGKDRGEPWVCREDHATHLRMSVGNHELELGCDSGKIREGSRRRRSGREGSHRRRTGRDKESRTRGPDVCSSPGWHGREIRASPAAARWVE